MDKLESIFKKWIKMLKNKNVYLAALVGNLIAMALIGVLGFLIILILALIAGPDFTTLLNFVTFGYYPHYEVYTLNVLAFLAIVGPVFVILYIYIGQIPIAATISALKGMKVGKAMSTGLGKIKSMGTAQLGALFILLLPMAIAFVPLIIGLLTLRTEGLSAGLSLLSITLILLIIAILVDIVLGLAFWVVPVVAYEKELGLGSLKISYNLFKKNWVEILVMAIVVGIVSSVISQIMDVFIRALFVSFISYNLTLASVIVFLLIAAILAVLVWTVQVVVMVSAQYAAYKVITGKK